jgi:hypothetical protein
MAKSPSGRVRFQVLRNLSVGVTLPFLFVVSFLGCREDTTSVTSSSAIPFWFVLSPGDSYRYNNWKLDEYGYRILSSQFRDSWTVADTGRSYKGRSPATFVTDSVFATTTSGADSLVRVETLIFHISPGGEIEQYGFLKSLLEPRLGTAVQPAWDQIAAFSNGTSQRWIVGYADTALSEPVYGSIEDQRDFVAVEVNGTQTLLLAYIVAIDSPDLEVTIWITDTPSAVLRIRDESIQSTSGSVKEIEAVRSAGR